jgi:hypothetical protein
MDFVKLLLDTTDETYLYKDSSNEGMSILGCFFTDDVRCSQREGWSFKDWALADKNDSVSRFTYHIRGNATFLEQDDEGFINLIDGTESLSESTMSKKIRMSSQQFVQLFDEWLDKVCKYKPREVIIKHVDDQFFIETNK